MGHKIKIDGQEILKSKHIITDKTELLAPQEYAITEQQVIDKTELGEALDHLNNDQIDEQDSRMSNIDLRSRLHHTEIASVLALDSLVSLGVLPSRCLAFTRQKKRLAVSLEGKGRLDIIEIVRGKEEREVTRSGMGKIKSLFGVN